MANADMSGNFTLTFILSSWTENTMKYIQLLISEDKFTKTSQITNVLRV